MSLNIIKKEISLNVGQPNNLEIINAVQGDNKSVEITATLYNLNKLYEINTDNIKIKGLNALGERIYKDISEHTDHTVTFQLTDDMLISDGLLKLVIVLYEKYQQLTTFPFVIRVFNAPGDTTAEDAISVSALVEAAENWALLSQSYAVGTENKVRDDDATDNAKYYYEKSNISADNAKKSEDNAKTSEINSKTSETNAAQSAKDADESKIIASEKSVDAQNYAKQTKSYTIGNTGLRENENIDNSKYYYEQIKSIAESFSDALRPMGTILFANLPSLTVATEGDMYNISDQFTTSSDFVEGEGNIIPAGSNVYKTADGKWDVLAGSPVTGVKGNTETTYRKGNVNITKENIGLGNVDNTSDANKPVSTAQQTALDGKVNKSGDTITGNLNVNGTVNIDYTTGRLNTRHVDGSNSAQLYLNYYNPSQAVYIGNAGHGFSNNGANYSGHAASATNADTVDGFHASQSAGAVNACVVTNSYGYLNANYINSNTGNNENPSVSQVIVTNGGDNYYRKASLQHVKNSMGLSTWTDISGSIYNPRSDICHINYAVANTSIGMIWINGTRTEIANGDWLFWLAAYRPSSKMTLMGQANARFDGTADNQRANTASCDIIIHNDGYVRIYANSDVALYNTSFNILYPLI